MRIVQIIRQVERMKLSIEGQDIETEFLKCDKVHYNLQDILCVINKLKEGESDGNG